MDMKEEKEKKLKEQFKKTYLDTVKHANDIEKWIDSGKRRQGDIRRSIQRLDSKYQSLLEIKKELKNQNSNEYTYLNKKEEEMEFNKFEYELSQKTEMTMNQMKNKIVVFHKLIESRQLEQTENDTGQIKNEITPNKTPNILKENKLVNKYYDNKIETVYDIPGNEKGLYYLEKRKGFLTRRNEYHRRKIFNIKELIIDKYYDFKYKLKHRKKAKINQNKNDEGLSEYEQYCMEIQKGYFRKRIDKIARKISYKGKTNLQRYKKKNVNQEKNKKEVNSIYKKVGRMATVLMAGTLALFGGTTVGESDADTIKKSNNDKSYVDINKVENNFKKSLYVQALEEETTIPSTVQETTIITNRPEETWSTQATFAQTATKPTELKKENKTNKNQSIDEQDKTQNQKNDLIIKNKETADDLYVLKANTKYTENSLGEGASGYVLKDTKVNIYNRALIKMDKNGNRSILNVTKVGQTWEDFAREQGIDYKEFRVYIDNNRSIQEMVSLDAVNGDQLGWVSKDKLEKVEIER